MSSPLLRNSRFTGPALLLLLLLNTALLVVLLLKEPEHGPPPHGPHPAGPRNFLVRELKLDPSQEAQYDALITEHRAQVDRLQGEIGKNRETLSGQPGISSAASDSLVRAIGDAQAEIERATFDHFRELRKICTPEQQKDFDRIIREAIRMMGPPPHPHGPPH